MANKYWVYFKYIVQHKWHVGIECFKEGLFLHAITHDLSKFRPSEFIPYARFFHSKNRTKAYKISDELDPNFLTGWNLHQKRNKHHWNYWVSVTRKNEIIPLPMPEKHIHQMICDWKGMARKFGGTWEKYYYKNKDNFILHEETEKKLNTLANKSGEYENYLKNKTEIEHKREYEGSFEKPPKCPECGHIMAQMHPEPDRWDCPNCGFTFFLKEIN